MRCREARGLGQLARKKAGRGYPIYNKGVSKGQQPVSLIPQHNHQSGTSKTSSTGSGSAAIDEKMTSLLFLPDLLLVSVLVSS